MEDLLTTIPLLRSSASTSSPFEVTHVGNKPNAIVRPTPRPPPTPPVIVDTQEVNLPRLETQIQQRNRDDSHTTGTTSDYHNKKPAGSGVLTVVHKRRLIPMDPLLQKPLFITTVPSGVFLAKDTVDLRKVYNYSSAPRVLKIVPNNALEESQSSFLAKVSSCLSTTKKSVFTHSESILNKSQRGFTR